MMSLRDGGEARERRRAFAAAAAASGPVVIVEGVPLPATPSTAAGMTPLPSMSAAM